MCTYNLTDDETLSLWDGSDFIFAAYTKQNWFIINYIGSVVFIGSNILHSIGYQNIGEKSYRYISIFYGKELICHKTIDPSVCFILHALFLGLK